VKIGRTDRSGGRGSASWACPSAMSGIPRREGLDDNCAGEGDRPMRTGGRSFLQSRPWWFAWDLAAILTFVVIGRSTHDHGLRPSGLARTSWPFLAGWAAACLLVVRRGWSGAGVRAGAVVVTFTVTFGMVLRVLDGQGTAFAFIVVTIVFLGVLMIGPRVAVKRRRSRPE
jgi:Protein of unknown function (DUF3054)